MKHLIGRMRSTKELVLFVFLLTIVGLATTSLVDRAEAESGLMIDLEHGRSVSTMAGTATVEVVTEPALCNNGRLRFTGVPSGEIVLGCETGQPVPSRTLVAANLPTGQRTSTLSFIDPSITDAGYMLVAIRCDDRDSQTPSLGNLVRKRATFGMDTNESVKCTFLFSTIPEPPETTECVCPKDGTWSVKNHLGQMACTGSVQLTMPLAPSTTSGTVRSSDNCSTLLAEEMSTDEASITYRRTPQCGYTGTVGGQQGGIPMTINFTLNVESDQRMTGELTSTVTKDGMTCNMKRRYEMDFRGQP